MVNVGILSKKLIKFAVVVVYLPRTVTASGTATLLCVSLVSQEFIFGKYDRNEVIGVLLFSVLKKIFLLCYDGPQNLSILIRFISLFYAFCIFLYEFGTWPWLFSMKKRELDGPFHCPVSFHIASVSLS